MKCPQCDNEHVRSIDKTRYSYIDSNGERKLKVINNKVYKCNKCDWINQKDFIKYTKP